MASPCAKGLFHRAIGQSGGLFEPLQLAPSYLLINAQRDGSAYVSSVGADSIAALRKLPAADLLGGKAASVSHPVVGTNELPVAPYDAFSLGSHNDVPLLVGFNAEEARAFNVGSVKAATFADDIKRRFGPLPAPLMDAYPHQTDAQALQSRLDLERDLRFGWDMWAWARLQAQPGRGRVYFYYFKQQPPFPKGSIYENWGASHFTELWYMFDHLNQEDNWRWSATDRQLAGSMASYWTNFAKSGDPNGEGLPLWPPFEGEGKVLHLGEPIAVHELPNKDRLQIFDAVYNSLRSKAL